jgi:hypothetical protein
MPRLQSRILPRWSRRDEGSKQASWRFGSKPARHAPCTPKGPAYLKARASNRLSRSAQEPTLPPVVTRLSDAAPALWARGLELERNRERGVVEQPDAADEVRSSRWRPSPLIWVLARHSGVETDGIAPDRGLT